MGIFQRQENWYYDFSSKGIRYREKVGPSKQLALLAMRKKQVEVAENRFLDIKREDRTKFKDFAQTYLEQYCKPNKKSWKQSDVSSLKQLVPFFGDRYLFEITPLMIEKFKNQRREAVSPATVNRDLACLKCMFNRAIDWEKLKENPVKKVKFFKENNERLRFLHKEEVPVLLDNCSSKLRAIVQFALKTGMRKAEIQNLKWTDADFQSDMITLYETKNGEKRYIPMNQIVKQILISVRKHPDSPYIFCDEKGKIYNFRKSFETALKKSSILNFRFHDLRHTFASHLVMAGADLNTVRELLGHKSLDMTLRYAHLSKDHKTRAVKLLDAYSDTLMTPASDVPEVLDSEVLVSL